VILVARSEQVLTVSSPLDAASKGAMKNEKKIDPIDAMAFGVMVITAILGLVTVATTAGCGYAVADEKALGAVAAEGYTSATITEKHELLPGWNGCDEKDTAGFDVTATNVNGQRVNLIVCCGLVLKGCTIRH
jgi:hypothetical protein